jgi:hypothetical protein
MGDPKLMSAFGFTEADLDTNKHGYMTKEQRRKLRTSRAKIGQLIFVVLLGGLISWVGLAFAIILFTGLVRFTSQLELLFIWSDSLTYLSIIVVIAAIIIFVWLAIIRFQNTRNVEQDLYKGDVNVIFGRARLDYIENQSRDRKGINTSSSTEIFRISHMQFDLTSTQKWALTIGDYYSFYYTPISREILSVEKWTGETPDS